MSRGRFIRGGNKEVLKSAREDKSLARCWEDRKFAKKTHQIEIGDLQEPKTLRSEKQISSGVMDPELFSKKGIPS